MYAKRFDASSNFSPAGLAAAAGINAALIGALLFAAPDWVPRLPDKPFGGTVIDIDPPVPPPPEPMPAPLKSTTSMPRSAPRVETVRPEVPTATLDGWRTTDPGPVTGDDGYGATGGGGTGVTVDPPAPPLPVIVGPAVDPRFARDLQPPYPPSEQRLGNAGKVTVRVLVGPDGRVLRVERVTATSDAFFRATEMQAMRRWRFRPGTRDGVAQEAWRTMTVTFVLDE